MRFPEVRAVHVGLPKCASTWLQRSVFARHPELALVGEQSCPEFFHLREAAASTAYEPRRVEVALERELARLREDGDSKVIVSFEGFSGRHASARSDRRVYERLSELFGRTKAILVVREQRDLLHSVWRHYVREGGTFSLKHYLTHPGSPVMRYYPHYSVYDRVLYDRIVAALDELFSVVYVLPYERLEEDPRGFARGVLRFLEVDVNVDLPLQKKNPGLSSAGTEIFRLLNRFTDTKRGSGVLPRAFYRRYRNGLQKIMTSPAGPGGDAVDSLLPEEARERIAASNQILSDGRSLRLEGYGYLVR